MPVYSCEALLQGRRELSLLIEDRQHADEEVKKGKDRRKVWAVSGDGEVEPMKLHEVYGKVNVPAQFHKDTATEAKIAVFGQVTTVSYHERTETFSDFKGVDNSASRALARPVHPDSRDWNGWTAIHHAAYHGQVACCRLLVDGNCVAGSPKQRCTDLVADIRAQTKFRVKNDLGMPIGLRSEGLTAGNQKTGPVAPYSLMMWEDCVTSPHREINRLSVIKENNSEVKTSNLAIDPWPRTFEAAAGPVTGKADATNKESNHLNQSDLWRLEDPENQAESYKDKTALHLAVERNHPEVVKFLIR